MSKATELHFGPFCLHGRNGPLLLEMALYCLWVRRHFQSRLGDALWYAERLHQLGKSLKSPVLEAGGDAFAGLSPHLCGRFHYARCLARVTTLNSIRVYRREWSQLLVESAESIKLSEHYSHRASLYWAQRQRALALAMAGQPEQGLPLLWQTLQTLEAQGNLLGLPLDYTLGAECCINAGDFERARWALDAAWGVIRTNGTAAFESEVRRMEGELALAQAGQPVPAAESHFLQSLQIARSRHARILQLRAAVSLGRLWQRQGRNQEALQQLQPLYDGFTEGHDSPDLVLAKAFITQLQSCPSQ